MELKVFAVLFVFLSGCIAAPAPEPHDSVNLKISINIPDSYQVNQCQRRGSSCDAEKKCCPGLTCRVMFVGSACIAPVEDPAPARAPVGAICTKDDQCCSGSCSDFVKPDHGFCVANPPCNVIGNVCKSNSDCCYGLDCTSTDQGDRCLTRGGPKHGQKPCFVIGNSCKSGKDCCYGLDCTPSKAGDKCLPPKQKRPPCALIGNSCKSDKDCCATLDCTADKDGDKKCLQARLPVCIPDGGHCNPLRPPYCCSGTCDEEAGFVCKSEENLFVQVDI